MIFLMIFYTTIALVVTSIIWTIWSRRNWPPGPWSLPFVGYLPWLDDRRPYVTLTNLSRKYGSVYGLWLGRVYTVILTDSKIIRQTLMKDSVTGRAPLYLTHGIMNGYGLICAEGELWKDQRKFTYSCLRNFGALKNSLRQGKIEELIRTGVDEFIQTATTDPTFKTGTDPLPVLRHCIGNVMNAIVFGCTWSSDDDLWNWLQILQEEGTKHIGISGPVNFVPLLRFLPSFRSTINFIMDGKLKTHKVYKKLIEERMEEMNANPGCESSNIIEAFLTERERRISSDDPSKKFYSDEQLYHLLADVFGAGLDTTLTTLRWFFLFMCAFPEEQFRIQADLDSVCDERAVTLEDMDALPLIEASIAETQRIRSVVPLGIPHGALTDLVIEGFDVPKGAMIVPLQWAVHMSPRYWRYPELFNPGRFLDAEGRFYKPEAFIPFQTGKRMCVGEDLAKMFLFLFSASILQNFSVRCTNDKIDISGDCGITLNPKLHRFVFFPRNNIKRKANPSE